MTGPLYLPTGIRGKEEKASAGLGPYVGAGEEGTRLG